MQILKRDLCVRHSPSCASTSGWKVEFNKSGSGPFKVDLEPTPVARSWPRPSYVVLKRGTDSEMGHARACRNMHGRGRMRLAIQCGSDSYWKDIGLKDEFRFERL
jgi:hypothetical protein